MSAKNISMRTQVHESDGSLVLIPHQQPIGFDVAFPQGYQLPTNRWRLWRASNGSLPTNRSVISWIFRMSLPRLATLLRSRRKMDFLIRSFIANFCHDFV
jgi:hypothetical protein